jgi:hypothetical protein
MTMCIWAARASRLPVAKVSSRAGAAKIPGEGVPKTHDRALPARSARPYAGGDKTTGGLTHDLSCAAKRLLRLATAAPLWSF